MKSLLVVVDYQNDFVSGALGSEAARSIEPALCRRIFEAKASGTDVVFTKDTHGPEYPSTNEGAHIPVAHCVRGTPGWELHGRVAELSEGCTILEKGTFGSEELAHILKEGSYGDVEICGVATNICVVVNAAIARTVLPQARIRVNRDLVASYDGSLGESALKVMESFCIDIE